MLGKNHLVVGTLLGAGTIGALRALSKVQVHVDLPEEASWLQKGANGLLDGIVGVAGNVVAWVLPYGFVWWWIVPAVIVFWIGSLFPDIDNENSILGRYNPIPLGPHRGITHTDWIALIFLSLAFVPIGFMRLFFFFAFGIFIHDELDGWSHAGRARFWPLGSWKTIQLGNHDAVVLKNPRRVTYKVGQSSEIVFAVIFSLLGIAGIILGVIAR